MLDDEHTLGPTRRPYLGCGDRLTATGLLARHACPTRLRADGSGCARAAIEVSV